VSFDLDAESRRALELDVLLDGVAGFARTPFGARLVRELTPSTDLDAARAELAAVGEALAFVESEGLLVPRRLPDPGSALELLQVEGSILEPQQLRGLAQVLFAADDLRRRLRGMGETEQPALTGLREALGDWKQEAAVLLSCVDGDGRLADEASPELRRIRRAWARTGERLERELRSMLRRPDAGAVYQDEFITERGGRYVVPVRTDSPRRVRGIVHATSSSGATQFVEPLESVELNNERVRLLEQEQAEVRRILLEWCDGFRERIDEVRESLAALARADGMQARALFARDSDAVLPRIEPGAELHFESVRHPLLDAQMRASGGRCIPLDITLDPADQVLVLSGPNTGGKTVALKTFGLAVLMAQSGIPVPARCVRMPLYRQLRADIGDHQSIEANLSTYSAHIRAIVGFLEAARGPALFLFDEIGSGTEPSEGAALAQSILESLRHRGITTMATTHQDRLKVWALTTDGAGTAAMEFDAETLRPTYRILMGAAGESAGLEIAERLGLDHEIVERARDCLGPEKLRTREYTRRLRELMVASERERDLARTEKLELEGEREKLRVRAEREREALQRQVESSLDRTQRELRTLVKKELQGLSDEREATARKFRRVERRVESELGKHRTELGRQTGSGAAPPREAVETVAEGSRVYVESLGREGQVRRVRGRRVEVQLGGIGITVEVDDLRVASPEGADRAPGPESRAPGRAGGLEGAEVPLEINLVGERVADATERLDKFLDESALAGHDEIRVIHGHGTGRLRRAVRQFLRAHAHVQSHRPGKSYEGGDGATVVRLK